MKKLNKALVVGLIGASALTGGMMLSGCKTNEKNNDNTNQEQVQEKDIVGISVNENSIPQYIIKDRFDQAKISIIVMYNDSTFDLIYVTEDLLNTADKAKVQTLGEHSITINYEGKIDTIDVNIISKEQLFDICIKDLANKSYVMTNTTIGGDGQSSVVAITKHDLDNKIIYSQYLGDDEFYQYTWMEDSSIYQVEIDGARTLGFTTWQQVSLDKLGYDSDFWTGNEYQSIPEITVDSDNNYRLTVVTEDNGDKGYSSYIYNMNGIIRAEYSYDEGGDGVMEESAITTIDISQEVNLTVPNEVKDKLNNPY